MTSKGPILKVGLLISAWMLLEYLLALARSNYLKGYSLKGKASGYGKD